MGAASRRFTTAMLLQSVATLGRLTGKLDLPEAA